VHPLHHIGAHIDHFDSCVNSKIPSNAIPTHPARLNPADVAFASDELVQARVGNQILRDSLEWDLAERSNDPELFAASMCAEMGLGPEHTVAIAMAIREQLDACARQGGKCGVITTRTAVREPEQLEDWTPYLDAMTEEELAKAAKDEAREARILAREATGSRVTRGGIGVPIDDFLSVPLGGGSSGGGGGGTGRRGRPPKVYSDPSERFQFDFSIEENELADDGFDMSIWRSVRSKTGYMGTTKVGNRYHAQIHIPKQGTQSVGTFRTLGLAVRAYAKAYLQINGTPPV